MLDKKIRAFHLPKATLTGKWDFDLKELFKGLEGAKTHFSLFQDANDNLKVLHSGMNEELYALLQAALHRNIEVHDFMKISLINVQKFREGEMNEAFEIMNMAVEYIRVKNHQNQYL